MEITLSSLKATLTSEKLLIRQATRVSPSTLHVILTVEVSLTHV